MNKITFQELIQYGRDNGGNIVDGMPWSFTYKGHPITHVSDQLYFVGIKCLKMLPSDMLIITDDGGAVVVERPKAPTGTEARVCADIAARQALGIAKYGTTVEDNPLSLRAWLEHHYQELLDAAVYARRAIEKIDKCPVCEDVRKRLQGHPCSRLDGGLAAATMRGFVNDTRPLGSA